MHGFRKSLLAAAEQSYKAGEIDRSDVFRLRLATSLPRVLARLEADCCDEAASRGLASATAIDWQQLIPLLREMLPVILEIVKSVISLF